MPTSQTSPHAKLASGRVDSDGTTRQRKKAGKPMCSKAEWFRARNSVDRSVADAPPSNSLLVARAKAELDRYPNQWL